MNQIPNIEEIKKILPCIDPQCDNQGTTITVNSDGEPEQMQCEYCYRERFPILDYFHHQLQKARQDWLRQEIVKLEGGKRNTNFRLERDKPYTIYELSVYTQNCCADIGFNQALQTIIERYHSELDQPNK